MPGRLRTASSPLRTVIFSAVYSLAFRAPFSSSFFAMSSLPLRLIFTEDEHEALDSRLAPLVDPSQELALHHVELHQPRARADLHYECPARHLPRSRHSRDGLPDPLGPLVQHLDANEGLDQ